MKFSERIGAVRRVLQKESMDDGLRNSLWNVVYGSFLEDGANNPHAPSSDFLLSLWTDQLDEPADDASRAYSYLFKQIKQRYMADDAKFFLVSCSAFVNYLIAKSTSTVPES